MAPDQSRQAGLLVPEASRQGTVELHKLNIGVLAKLSPKIRTEGNHDLHVRPSRHLRQDIAYVRESAARAGREGVDE